MSSVTTAERRSYQQICGDDGAMMVIACGQCGGMRTILAKTPEAQATISNATSGEAKMDITAYLAGQAGCVLVDPLCAVPARIDEGAIHGSTGMLIGLDASGFDMTPVATEFPTYARASPPVGCANLAAPGQRL